MRNWFKNLINYNFYFRKENDSLKKLKMIIFTSIFDIDYFSLNYRIWFSQPWMVTMFASLLTDKQEVERLSPWSETETRGFLESLRGLLIEFTVWLTKLGKLVFYFFFPWKDLLIKNIRLLKIMIIHHVTLWDKCMCVCVLYIDYIWLCFWQNATATRSSTLLNAIYVSCRRIVTFRNVLIQIYANLLKNDFPPNIVPSR